MLSAFSVERLRTGEVYDSGTCRGLEAADASPGPVEPFLSYILPSLSYMQPSLSYASVSPPPIAKKERKFSQAPTGKNNPAGMFCLGLVIV